MNKEALQAAANAASVAGLAGLFLPSLDATWNADDDSFTKYQLDSGTTVYLAVAGSVAALQSLAVGSPLPLIVGGALAFVVVMMHHHAYSIEPPPEELR